MKTSTKFKTLFETYTHKEGYFYSAKYVEYNGKKFRFICLTKNGDPCGFKTNKCLEIMIENGLFESVVDCNMIGYPYQNSYYHSEYDEIKYRDGLYKAFENFIEKVY